MIPIPITLGAVYGGDNVIIIANDAVNVVNVIKINLRRTIAMIEFGLGSSFIMSKILKVIVIEMVSSAAWEKTGVVFLFDERLLAPFQMPTIRFSAPSPTRNLLGWKIGTFFKHILTPIINVITRHRWMCYLFISKIGWMDRVGWLILITL